MSERTPSWRRYLRFVRSNAAADLDDEIAFHLAARIDELVAGGMTPELAEAAALQRLGDLARFRSQALRVDRQLEREQTMRDHFDTIIADVTFALRQLRRSPALAIAAVLCFALGIGVNSAVFSVVNGVLLRPLPYRDADRVVGINEGLPKMGPGMGRIAAAELLDYRELDGRVFQATAIFEQRSFTIRGADGSLERAPGALVSGNFLRVLGREPALGRIPATWLANAHDPTAAPPTDEIIVSYSFWRTRLGGDSSIIGRTMQFGPSGVATVAAVMPPAVPFPIGGLGVTPADIFALYTLTPGVLNRRGDNYGTWAFGRLADGVSIEQANAAVANVATSLPRRYPTFYGQGTAQVVGGVAPLREQIVGEVRRPLLVLLGAVCLVLLIACLNVSSLLVARALARQREIAVRRAIGASRSRLAQQFLTESLVLVGIGGFAGLMVGRYGAALLSRFDPSKSLNGYDVGVDWRVVALTAAVTGLTGIVFSVLPGIAGRDDLQTALRDAAQGKALSRSGLVVAEIAIALLLTVGAGLMVRSFLQLRAVNPGFSADHLLTFRVTFPESRYKTGAATISGERLLAQRLGGIPGVKAVSAGSDIPAASGSLIGFTPDPAVGPLPDKVPISTASLVQANYFETLGIPVRAGRTFTEADGVGSEPVAIIDESLARKHFAGGSAIGRRIKWGSVESPQPWRTVIGVVGEVKQQGLTDDGALPSIYFPAAQFDSGPVMSMVRGQTYMVKTSGDPRAVTAAVRRLVKDFDGMMPVTGVRSMDEALSSTIADRRFNTFLLGAFAAVALGLAAVGIYGLIAYSVAQRTRELGIRIALGALPADVLLLVLRQGGKLAAAGIVIGSAGAVAATRWMRSMLFHVDPLDPLTFGAVAVALVGVAIAASWAPARRAARVSPVTAMRNE
jgi:predicted permease